MIAPETTPSTRARRCKNCNEPFIPAVGTPRPQVFCGVFCRRQAWAKAHPRAPAPARFLDCLRCGKPTEVTGRRQTYCSAICRNEVKQEKARARARPRRSRMRSKSITARKLSNTELQIGALLFPPDPDIERPSTRGDCEKGEGGCNEIRPCPWVSCKHHLYLDVNPETGTIKLNFPDLEVWEMDETCALDVADRNGITLEEVGEIMNLTRERIRQVEVRGLLKLKMMGPIEQEVDASAFVLEGDHVPARSEGRRAR